LNGFKSSNLSEETQSLYMMKSLNLVFYSHAHSLTHISCGKHKLKHVHLMCKNQWGSWGLFLWVKWASVYACWSIFICE